MSVTAPDRRDMAAAPGWKVLAQRQVIKDRTLLACLITWPSQSKTGIGGLRLCHIDHDKPMEDPT